MRNFSPEEIEKFNKKTVKGQNEDDCWGWLGAKGSNGYSIFKIKYERFRAGRVSYFLENGIDPKEFDVCHTCDNPICCNPGHLFLGTRTENMQDAANKNRTTKGSKNKRAKLTEKDIPIIIDLHKNKKINQYKLAKMYGVNQPTINRVVNRVLWGHVKV